MALTIQVRDRRAAAKRIFQSSNIPDEFSISLAVWMANG